MGLLDCNLPRTEVSEIAGWSKNTVDNVKRWKINMWKKGVVEENSFTEKKTAEKIIEYFEENRNATARGIARNQKSM